MIKHNKKRFLLIGFLVAVITFVLLLVGIKYVLNNNLTNENIIAFLVLAIIFGVLSSGLYYYKMWVAFTIFIIGITIGYFEMYRMFINGMGGWGDLTGLMSLFVWATAGFVTGLIIEFLVYLYIKYKDKRNRL
ncbi:MAG: hypothetical protein K0R15_889 [Clostridiales bacterium]|jgi:hypothetical protein|nr:hypothetical protein [Clostridiales bacterium]